MGKEEARQADTRRPELPPITCGDVLSMISELTRDKSKLFTFHPFSVVLLVAGKIQEGATR
jgi:hypothetical protein